jgi:hypothetical protein
MRNLNIMSTLFEFARASLKLPAALVLSSEICGAQIQGEATNLTCCNRSSGRVWVRRSPQDSNSQLSWHEATFAVASECGRSY